MLPARKRAAHAAVLGVTSGPEANHPRPGPQGGEAEWRRSPPTRQGVERPWMKTGAGGGQGRRTRGWGSLCIMGGKHAQRNAAYCFTRPSGSRLRTERVEQQCIALLQSIPPSTTGSANHARAHDWLRDVAKTLFIPSDSQLRPPPFPSHPERQTFPRAHRGPPTLPGSCRQESRSFEALVVAGK